MNKKLYVRIDNWKSKYYPYIARFKHGTVEYSLVFENKDQVKKYFDTVYCYKTVIYRGL